MPEPTRGNRWFVVEERRLGTAPHPESFDEDELRRRFPALIPLLDQPGFVGCRWTRQEATGLTSVHIRRDK